MIVATEYDVQRRGVNDENAEAGSSEDTCEVPIVAHDAFAEWERKFGFDCEDIEALDDEDREIGCGVDDE